MATPFVCRLGKSPGDLTSVQRWRRAQMAAGALACSLALLLPTAARAQIAEVALSGVVVGKLIDQFEETATRIIQTGENSGNALVVSAGNQVHVSIRNAGIMLSDQRDKTFDQLDNGQREFFTQLNTMVRSASGPIDRAVTVLETANLNLIELTNRLPLTHKTYAYMNSAKGLTQPFFGSDFQFSFTGLGFGQDTTGNEYRVSVSVDGKQLDDQDVVRVPPYTLNVRVPAAMLNGAFDDHKVKTAELVVTVNASLSDRCWVLFNCRHTQTSSWPLKVTLLPKKPGKLQGVEIIRGQAPDGTIQTTSVSVTTSGCRTHTPCDWSREVNLADDQRAVGVRYACSGQCGWSYALRKGGYAADFDILEGGRKVVVYRHLDGADSTTVTYYVDYQTLKPVVIERSIQPVDLAFGKLNAVALSADNAACAYRFNGKLVTGQEFYLDNGMSQTPDGLLQRISTGMGPNGAACVPVFALNVP